MFRCLKVGLVFLLTCVLASCALSPQQITIKPEIKVPVATHGAGQEIQVRVEDKRPSTVIGKRGGVYSETSTIEIGNDYKTEIAFAVAGGLTRWGFKSQVSTAAGSASGEAAELLLTLNKLDYTPDSNPAVGKVHINAAIAVEIKQGQRTYHGNYEASGEMGYVTVPSQARNNEQINLILNMALQKMFDDPSLAKFFQ